METSKAGHIVWFEVIGQDSAKLQAFYGELFNWKIDNESMPGYGLTASEQTTMPGGVGSSPGGGSWATFYVQSDDIEASVARANQLGGSTLVPPNPLPSGDLLAMIKDPEGHIVGLFQCKPEQG